MSERQTSLIGSAMPKQHYCLRSSRLLPPRRLAAHWHVRRQQGMVEPPALTSMFGLVGRLLSACVVDMRSLLQGGPKQDTGCCAWRV